jgi:hypothetical protein
MFAMSNSLNPKMTSKIKFSLAAAVVALLVGSSASAQVTFFGEAIGAGDGTGLRVAPNPATTGAQSSFLASLTNPGVEDFEGAFASSAVFGNGVTATLVGGSLTSQLSGANSAGRYPTSGTQFWTSAVAFSINFNQGISAFGFYGIDIGDFNGQLSLTLFNGASNLGNFVVPNTIGGSGGGILYYGIITPFTFDRVSFGNTASGTDFFGFDDFTVGVPSQVNITPVPEPSTYGLIGAAVLVGATLYRRRLQAKRAA